VALALTNGTKHYTTRINFRTTLETYRSDIILDQTL